MVNPCNRYSAKAEGEEKEGGPKKEEEYEDGDTLFSIFFLGPKEEGVLYRSSTIE